MRHAVGWSKAREALYEDLCALRVTDVWQVVATLNEIQPDRLRRVETWLWREDRGDDAPQFALLLDFIPVTTGVAGSGYTLGDRVRAELVFYPSSEPLRTQIVRTTGGAEHASALLPFAPLSIRARLPCINERSPTCLGLVLIPCDLQERVCVVVEIRYSSVMAIRPLHFLCTSNNPQWRFRS